MDVRLQVGRRWAAAITAVAVAAVPAGASAAPGSPTQTEPTTEERSPDADSTLVDVDVLVSTNAAGVATELADLETQISEQLDAYNAAQTTVTEANASLANADSALQNTQLLIEDTTTTTDQVVVDAFISPPAESSLDVLTSESLTEATVKQTILDMEADRSAASLTDLQEALANYETLEAAQEEALSAAETARADAEAALADLDSTLTAQAQFVTAVETALADQGEQAATDDPYALMRPQQIATALSDAAEADALRDAAEAAAAARQRKIDAGVLFCPVDGPVDFIDSWGYSRSGGRSHKGVDMMADHGVPTVAPVSGQVEHRGTSLGGLSWYLYGDNGNTYYGTHLQGYANEGVGWVEAGTLIGYVGSSGNAAASGPHLHFEIHPGGGSPTNPYPATAEACFGGG